MSVCVFKISLTSRLQFIFDEVCNLDFFEEYMDRRNTGHLLLSATSKSMSTPGHVSLYLYSKVIVITNEVIDFLSICLKREVINLTRKSIPTVIVWSTF